MTVERLCRPELIGATPLGVLYCIASLNPQIGRFNFWTYVYQPLNYKEKGKNPNWASRDDILKISPILQMMDDLKDGEQLAVSSQIILVDGKRRHIPMMDLEVQKDEHGLGKTIDRLRHLEIHNGWVLETGQSYQFYGNDILTDRQWLDFLGRCLLTSIVHTRQDIEQVTDPRFIGHTLRRGCTTLRITTKADKTFVPRVVAQI